MDENPPAFPRTGEGFGNPLYDAPGMSLRDYFAGQALVGILADPVRVRTNGITRSSEVAGHAYSFADAMLAVRALLSEEK